MYPSMFTRGQDIEVEPYYCLPVGTIPNPMAAHQNAGLIGKTAVPWSQPTSPTPPSRFSNGPLSPTHASYRLTYPKKSDDGEFNYYLVPSCSPFNYSFRLKCERMA